MNKDVFTSKEAAVICRTSVATIHRLFDEGLLEGYLVPGSRHRRIPKRNLVAFLKKHKMFLPPELDCAATNLVLVVSKNETVRRKLREVLESRSIEVVFAGDSFEAGMKMNTRQPIVCVADFSCNRTEMNKFCHNLCGRFSDMRLIALLPSRDMSIFLANEEMHKPFDISLLAEHISNFTGFG